MRLAARLLASLLLLAACGGDDAATADASPGSDGGADGGGGACARQAGVADRALVVTLNRDTGSDGVAVYTLESGGRIVDHKIEIGGFVNPRFVTIRSDGKEALVAYGFIGGTYGVAVITLAPDGTSASMKQILELGSGMSPFGIAYGSDDHAVMAIAAGTTHQFAAIDRGVDGMFAAGPVSTNPDQWALDLYARPGSERVVMLRADLLGDPNTSELVDLSIAGSWTKTGASGLIHPASIDAAVSADGANVYSPTDNPDDLVSPTHLDSTGKLFSFHFVGDDLVADPVYDLPHAGTEIAVAPDKSFVVTDDPVHELDGSGNPNVRNYQLVTTQLGGDGLPTTSVGTTKPFPALLFNGFLVAPGNLLVTALELYPDQAPMAGQTHPIVVWRQASPGDWQPACDTVYVDGLPAIAIAP